MPFKPLKTRAYGTTKEVVSRLFAQAGGVPIVMKILELSRTRTYALADPNDRARISFERVEKITQRSGATAAAEHLASLAGGIFLPGPAFGGDTPDDDGDWHSLASRAGICHADNISELIKSISPDGPSPGEVDGEEARVLLEKVDAQLAILTIQRQRLIAILDSDQAPTDDG